MSKDPLLQPFQLKHLTLKNRIMTTSHEPAYPEDGMPKERYAAYHAERAKAGVAMVMTAGSAAVSRDSPPVFNNVLAYRDDVVPWIQNLTDAVHEYGRAAMSSSRIWAAAPHGIRVIGCRRCRRPSTVNPHTALFPSWSKIGILSGSLTILLMPPSV